jgi:hypothetical protein
VRQAKPPTRQVSPWDGETEEKQHENVQSTFTIIPVANIAQCSEFHPKTLCPLCLKTLFVRGRFAIPATSSHEETVPEAPDAESRTGTAKRF